MHEDLTNGVEDLPPRREVQPRVDIGAWRAIAAAALLLAALAVCLSVALFAVWRSEAATRRDQNCLTFEGQHADEVRDLGNSYSYLLRTRRAGWDDTQRFVFERQLPVLEADAARDNDRRGVRVPAYCDDPGAGLAEPDPCLPQRPAVLGPRAVEVPRQRHCRKIVRVADLREQR